MIDEARLILHSIPPLVLISIGILIGAGVYRLAHKPPLEKTDEEWRRDNGFGALTSTPPDDSRWNEDNAKMIHDLRTFKPTMYTPDDATWPQYSESQPPTKLDIEIEKLNPWGGKERRTDWRKRAEFQNAADLSRQMRGAPPPIPFPQREAEVVQMRRAYGDTQN